MPWRTLRSYLGTRRFLIIGGPLRLMHDIHCVYGHFEKKVITMYPFFLKWLTFICFFYSSSPNLAVKFNSHSLSCKFHCKWFYECTYCWCLICTITANLSFFCDAPGAVCESNPKILRFFYTHTDSDYYNHTHRLWLLQPHMCALRLKHSHTIVSYCFPLTFVEEKKKVCRYSCWDNYAYYFFCRMWRELCSIM